MVRKGVQGYRQYVPTYAMMMGDIMANCCGTEAFTSLVEAGWQHPPPPSKEPLLELTCRPRLKPYVKGLSPRPGVLFDAKVHTPFLQLSVTSVDGLVER